VRCAINFSFVLPSIGDYDRLRKMFNSFERTTKCKDKIEFLVAIDTGKTDIVKAIEGCKYSYSIKFFERDKTRDFTNDYYNWLADRSIGDNIITFNDDTWMRTDGWDKKLLRTIRDIGESLYLVDILDTARIKYKNDFPCFPLISRRAFCTLGFVLCPKVKMYPADKATVEIYRQANMEYKSRNILIEHEHIPETDDSKKHMLDIFEDDKEEQQKGIDIGEYIYKLLQVASNKAKEPSRLQRIMNIIKEK
jgi:hypothetical protein